MEVNERSAKGPTLVTVAHTTEHDPFGRFNVPSSPILFPVGERPVGWQRRDGSFQKTVTHKAIIRLNEKGDNAQMLNIVGSSYKIVHNRELFTAVEDAMKTEMLPEHLKDVRVQDRVAGWGKVCYREYIFPSVRCRIPSVRSDIAFRIIAQNGYGGSALRIHAGAIDFYCTNGMIRGDYTSTYKRHTSGLVVAGLSSVITKALMQFTESAVEWERWAKTPVKHAKAMALFEAIADSAKMKDGLLDQYTRETDARGDSLWSVYSALTYYSSHNDGAFSLRRSVEEQDTTTSIMLKRELNVAKWIQSDEWKALEQV